MLRLICNTHSGVFFTQMTKGTNDSKAHIILTFCHPLAHGNKTTVKQLQ